MAPAWHCLSGDPGCPHPILTCHPKLGAWLYHKVMRKLIPLISLILSVPAWSQAVSPPDRAWTASPRPTISADFDSRVRGARVWVDGTEFTNYARTRGDTVTLVPPYNLDYGLHRVQVITNNGRRADWSFNIVNDDRAYTPNYDPYYYPNANDPYYRDRDGYYQNRDPYYYPDNDNRLDLEDVLPSIIRLIPNR